MKSNYSVFESCHGNPLPDFSYVECSQSEFIESLKNLKIERKVIFRATIATLKNINYDVEHSRSLG